MRNWFRIIGGIILCLIGVTAQASGVHRDTIRAPRPKVGVVLGGGGAKGAAHIGVLKYIEEMGIPVDYVAGTSMGAIIGGLYAVGYSPDEMAELIAGMNWSEYVGNSIDRSAMSPEMRRRNSTMFMNIPFGTEGIVRKEKKTLTDFLPSAYVNNTALINLFNDLCIGYQEENDFNDLPIPFACVATDITTGKEVVIRHGSVPTAMRASMAIPGVFAPVLIDHKVLVDGGLVNNFPADVLKEMGADLIIGVEVTDSMNPELEEVPSLPTVLSYLINNAVNSKREDNRHLCTLYLNPDISGYGTLSFTPEAIDTLVHRGYRKAQQNHEQLVRIKQFVDKKAGRTANKTLNAPKAKSLKDAPIFISSITMNQSGNIPSDWLAKKGELDIGKYIGEKDIDRAMNIYRGTGAFDDVTYNIYESDYRLPDDSETYSLVLNFKPTLPHIIGIGTRYDTEEGAAMLINLGLNEKRLSGFKLNLSGRLSYNPRFNATATYSMIPVANFNLAYDYRSQHFKMMVQSLKKNTNLHYSQHRFSLYASQFQLLNFNSSLGLSYATTHFDQTYLDAYTFDTTGMAIVQTNDFDDNRLFGPFLSIQYDNRDHAYFARHGINSNFDVRLYFDPDRSPTLIQDYSFSIEGYTTPQDNLTFIPQFYARAVLGNTRYANLWNVIGGDIPGRHLDQQMPFIGVSHLNETSEISSILRCDVRYNLVGRHYVTGMANVLFGAEIQNLRQGKILSECYLGLGGRYSYNSPIGPIALTAQWSNCTKEFSLYFSLGYNF